MQGTIKNYDEKTRSGVVVDDQRNEYHYDQESYRGMGMRLFRIGQRVNFTLEGEGQNAKVRDLHILTVHA